jgi:signal recognition particle receptor subunit beta
MALFDLEKQRVCVRVVYDGVASAGKTTNLRQLAELFASQPTCEIFSPAEIDGRTLYFDWLQIAAGMVCGFPLVCQVITVPGQVVLTPRRRHLLATADVVVYVCDSDAQASERAREGLAPFDRIQEERGETIPLVVQANKQDQPGALSGSQLLAAVGRTGVPVVEAVATDGIGVVDTFAAAVRTAVRSIQARVESGAFKVAVQPAETPAEALTKLSDVIVDPEWAAEMVLEEAAAAFESAETVGETHAEEPATDRDTVRPKSAHAPAFPAPDVPPGFVWPAHTGRAVLLVLAAVPATKLPLAVDGDGRVCVSIGEQTLSTRVDLRFENAEAGRQALVRAARERTQLGPLLPPETVLVAQPAPDGSSWLWTIQPKMPTVSELASERDRTDAAATKLLATFGGALADALHVEAKHAVVLDLSLRSFGVQHGLIRYVGELGSAEPRDVGRALGEALAALAGRFDDLEPAVVAFEAAIAAKLPAEELVKLAGPATWSTGADAPPAARGAHRRMEAALLRGRTAA